MCDPARPLAHGPAARHARAPLAFVGYPAISCRHWPPLNQAVLGSRKSCLETVGGCDAITGFAASFTQSTSSGSLALRGRAWHCSWPPGPTHVYEMTGTPATSVMEPENTPSASYASSGASATGCSVQCSRSVLRTVSA